MKKRILNTLFFLLLISLGHFCAPQKGECGSPVNLQLRWTHSFQFAGYYMAKAQGFFDAADLDVRFIEGGVGISHVENVTRGKAQYGVAGSELVLAENSGLPVVVLAAIYQHSPYVLMVRKELNISNPQQLVGDRVMLGDKERTAELWAMFIKEGVPVSKLVSVPVPFTVEKLRNPDNAAFAAYVTNEPYLAESLGIPMTLLLPQTYGIDFYGDSLFTTRREIQQYPERAAKMREACIKGWQYVFDHPEEAIDLVMQQYNPGQKNRAFIQYEYEQIRKLVMPDHIPMGTMSPDRWRRIFETYGQLGLTGNPLNLSEFVYNPVRIARKKTEVLLKYGTAGLCLLAFAVLLFWFWTRSLRRRVAARTMDLEKEIDVRKTTELQLRKREEALKLFEVVVSSASEPMAVIDRDYRYILVNRGYEKFWNIQKEDLIGRKAPDILGKEFFEHNVKPKVDRCLAGETVSYSQWFESPVYGPRFMNLNYHPYRSSDGIVLGLINISYDATHMKRAEDTLQHQQTSLERTERIAHVGSWEWEIAEDRVTWSEELFRIFGLEPAENAPTWAEHDALYHPEDMKKLRRFVEKALSDGTAYEMELRAFRADGETRICFARGFPETGPDGRVHRLFGSLQDITEYQHAKRQLQESEAFLKTLIDAIPIPLFYKDTHGRYIGFNRAFESFFGKNRQEMIGKAVRDMGPKGLTDVYRQKDLELLEKGGEQVYESKVENALGETRNVIFYKAVYHNSRGEVAGLIGTILDITERTRMEGERAKLKEQLFQSQKMESIGTLAGGIAHDFNNILTIMWGNTDLAMDEIEKTDAVFEFLSEIKDACRRAKELIQQILNFSRRSEMEKKPVHLKPLIEASRRFLRASIPSTIEIRKRILADTDAVLGDETQIYQILLNMCTNAAHAMEKRGGILDIRLENRLLEGPALSRYHDLKPGPYLVLKVKDTGEGMSPEILERVFEPYFTTKAPGKGTGMGLAVVHGIVKSHGGDIKVQSEAGKGTLFEILLPELKNQTSGAEETAEALSRGDERILFVDDELSIAGLNVKRLTRLGYSVEAVTRGDEALRKFNSNADQYDLIITDMTMPGMTGDELTLAIKKIRPDIPVILCTGFSSLISMDRAKSLGIDKYLEKPVRIEVLAAAIREVLDGRRGT